MSVRDVPWTSSFDVALKAMSIPSLGIGHRRGMRFNCGAVEGVNCRDLNPAAIGTDGISYIVQGRTRAAGQEDPSPLASERGATAEPIAPPPP